MYIFTGLSVIMKDMKISNNLNFDFLQREIENFAKINITNLDYFKELGASFINDVKNNPINIKKYKNHSLYNIEYVEILPYMAINRLYYWNSFCKKKNNVFLKMQDRTTASFRGSSPRDAGSTPAPAPTFQKYKILKIYFVKIYVLIFLQNQILREDFTLECVNLFNKYGVLSG